MRWVRTRQAELSVYWWTCTMAAIQCVETGQVLVHQKFVASQGLFCDGSISSSFNLPHFLEMLKGEIVWSCSFKQKLGVALSCCFSVGFVCLIGLGWVFFFTVIEEQLEFRFQISNGNLKTLNHSLWVLSSLYPPDLGPGRNEMLLSWFGLGYS